MKLATAPINWNNEDVRDYRPWTPYPRILDEIVRAGYKATEWSTSLPTDPKRLERDLADRGLVLLGAFVGLELRTPTKREEELERALVQARFLRALGARYLVAADSGDAQRQRYAGRVTPELGLSEAQWRSLTEGLHALGERLQALGMRLVFHNHAGTYVETPEETARLLEQTDPDLVGWCLDTGHLVYGGGEVPAMLARYGKRVAYVHLKDVNGRVLEEARRAGYDFSEALRRYVFAPLGQGIARIPEIVAALKAHGYAGWLVLEQDTTPDDPTEVARKNRAYLEEVLRAL
ncbi:TIM barrel protein [Marinithermus hydrothermalis]|uniref:Myo-inosose-2 dehydratase n=1 Tax=Marinithermus hydrothermalis (strain DSM 14884 / JCM 11576 / T1) TaxID=869210 RepID=F2NQG4_MARHT|nr:TIM barrel protein [Marinithermus hydrothermalis]AEB11691.1 Myo-inosose-2 dehydratase [Marinithermus hydrothermalis DSM 14884]